MMIEREEIILFSTYYNITECEVYSQFSLHISGISDFNCNFFDNRFFF